MRWRTHTAWALGVLCSIAAATAEPPCLDVPIIDTAPPVIDGNLTEPFWQRAADVTDFRLLNTGERPAQGTEVWLARNDSWLFVAFRCKEPDAGQIRCQVTERSGSVHRDDSVEVFLSPGTGGDTYWHFLINAAGVQSDNRSKGRDHNIEWDGHWRSATVMDAEQGCWTAELAIPLFYLTARTGNAEWTGNFARTRRTGAAEFSTWSPVKGSYHVPESFGTLRGLKGIKADPVFAPVLTTVDVGPLLDIPRRYYEVTAGLKNQGGVPGTVGIYAVDRTAEGETCTPVLDKDLGAGHAATVKVEVDVEKILVRSTDVVAVYEDDLGTWHWRTQVDRKLESKPLLTAMERSYYTQEKTGRLVYQVNLPPSIIPQTSIRIFVGDAADADQEVRLVGPEGAVPVALSALEEGTHRVHAELLGRDTAVLADSECRLVKRAPATGTGNVVRLDRWNRCLRVNGNPFFPFGFVSRSAAPIQEAMGCNTVIRWRAADREATLRFLDDSQRLGLMVIDTPTFNLPSHKISFLQPEWPEAFHEDVTEVLPGYIESLKGHPALIGWYGIDEPGWEVHKVACRHMTDTINTADGYHPNIQLFCGAPADDDEWLSYADINMVDIYAHDPLTTLAALRKYAAVADYLQQPNWVMLLGETCSGSPHILRPERQVCQTYLALITGATGIFYFRMPVTHVATFNAYKRLAADISTMSPALLARPPWQEVKVYPESAGRDRVPVLLRRFPDGDVLLLAANPRSATVDVSVGMSGLSRRSRVTDLQKRRQSVMNGDMFTDRLQGYGVRAWRVERMLEPESGKPIQIELHVKEHTPSKKKVSGLPATIADNLLTNGGFETEGGWRNMMHKEKGGQIDCAVAHSGKCSLRFDREKDDKTKVAISERFMLKPNTRYRYSGWGRVRAEASQRGLTCSVYSLTRNKALIHKATPLSPTWESWSGTFETDSDPQEVECYVYAAHDSFIGSGWVDDLRLVEVPEAPESRNILPNSGFEHATVPLRPDRWLFMPFLQFEEENLTGAANPFITQDDNEVFEGKTSLRLLGIQQMFTAPSRDPFPMEWGEPYVFSVYMKAGQDDTICWIRVNNSPWTQAVVGREWKRFHTVGKAPDERTPFLRVSLRTEGAGGVPLTTKGWWNGDRTHLTVTNAVSVWMDAAQLEKGITPTDYVADTWQPE